MELSNWKKVKRTGNFRRKVKMNLNKICNEYKEDLQSKNSESHTEQTTIVTPSSSQVETKINSIDQVEEDEIRSNWFIQLEPEEEEQNFLTDKEKNLKVRTRLRAWATSFRINQMALKEMINIWNERIPNLLPEDPRTLLITPRSIVIENLGDNGYYWHQGVKFCLEKYLKNIKDIPELLSLNFNIDGLPIYKSSKQEFWPILCNIYELPEIRPMAVGIYSGFGKPKDVNKFLERFVDEMKDILKNGILIKNLFGEFKILLQIRAFICDSPARAFIKGTINFNGKHGCTKCTTVGEYSYISHTTYFPRANCPKRTDQGFRSKLYESHHKHNTPLDQLPIDMIEQFPVSDSLHLIDLGLMKRCLLGWRDGSFGSYRTKWSANDITRVSNFLITCKMPREIHRAVRGIDCLAHWKGLEYRTFLHYISIVVLKDALPLDVYEHFLLFFCAVTICSTKRYFKFLDLAEALLDHYVETFRDFYGQDYITSNVHNLIHMIDDVRKFGELSSFSAYPFETKLYQIKNLLRNGNRPLVQVAKRLAEITQAETEINIAKKKYPILKKKCDDFFYKIEFENFLLSSEAPDNWFLTYDNKIIKVHYAIEQNGETKICGTHLEEVNTFFETPIRSSYLNIYSYIGNIEMINTNNLNSFRISDIKCKLVSVNSNTEIVFIPLLHSL